MPAPKRGDKTPMSRENRCDECFDRKNQARRHIHFLRFGNEGALGGHLHGQYGDAAELDGTIGAIIAWVRTIKSLYGGMVDENGVTLPAWQAWVLAQREAQKARGDEMRAPRTEQGRLFAAKVFDRLAHAYEKAHGVPVSASIRDEFLIALTKEEAEPPRKAMPLAESLSDIMRKI